MGLSIKGLRFNDGNASSSPGRTTIHNHYYESTRIYVSIHEEEHDLVTGDVVYFDNNTSRYELAQANNPTTLGIGVVEKEDENNFKVIFSGIVEGLSDLNVGSYYFVSYSRAGKVTLTEPTAPNFSNPIFYAIDKTKAVVIPLRPVIVDSNLPNTWGSFLSDNGRVEANQPNQELIIFGETGIITSIDNNILRITNQTPYLKKKIGDIEAFDINHHLPLNSILNGGVEIWNNELEVTNKVKIEFDVNITSSNGQNQLVLVLIRSVGNQETPIKVFCSNQVNQNQILNQKFTAYDIPNYIGNVKYICRVGKLNNEGILHINKLNLLNENWNDLIEKTSYTIEEFQD